MAMPKNETDETGVEGKKVTVFPLGEVAVDYSCKLYEAFLKYGGFDPDRGRTRHEAFDRCFASEYCGEGVVTIPLYRVQIHRSYAEISRAKTIMERLGMRAGNIYELIGMVKQDQEYLYGSKKRQTFAASTAVRMNGATGVVCVNYENPARPDSLCLSAMHCRYSDSAWGDNWLWLAVLR